MLKLSTCMALIISACLPWIIMSMHKAQLENIVTQQWQLSGFMFLLYTPIG